MADLLRLTSFAMSAAGMLSVIRIMNKSSIQGLSGSLSFMFLDHILFISPLGSDEIGIEEMDCVVNVALGFLVEASGVESENGGGEGK